METISVDTFKSIAEMGNDGIFVFNEDYKVEYANQMASVLTGIPAGELLGMDFRKVFPEVGELFLKDLEGNREKYQNKLCTVTRIKQRSGKYLDTYLCIATESTQQGRGKTYVYLTDISEQKRMENELRKARDFLMKLIDSSVDAIIATDMKGNILIFNKGAEKLLGYKAEEVIGKMNIKQIYPEGSKQARMIMSMLRSPAYGGVGKLNSVMIRNINKNGEIIHGNLSAAIVYENGKEVASVGIFTDLRERIKTEEKLKETQLQLLQAENMASIGKLAAGVAHEINNPLGGILIYATLMMEDMDDSDPRKDDLKRIVQETTRCKEIVKSLLEFAREIGPNREVVDINKAVLDSLFFLEKQAIFYNIEIKKELYPNLPKVLAHPGQLKQVFMNMMVNAADAMHGSGTLTIRTGVTKDKKNVWIEFIDTGEGIPEENLNKIFDPFFTTKEIGRGTGLGLSTSYGIIQDHKGKIDVKSKIGEGSTFRIEIPIKEEKKEVLASQFN